MKLCILGPEKKNEFHLKLIEKAKEHFEKVLYAPLSGVRIEASGDMFIPYYKAAPLTNFEIVLPLVSKKMAMFGSSVVTVIEENEIYTPISSAAINHAYNEFLTVMINKHIRAGRRNMAKVYLASSRDALNAVLPKLRYPVRIKTPRKDSKPASFESEASLRSFIDAIELFSQPLLIEEVEKESLKEMHALIMGSRIYCLSEGTAVKPSVKVRELMKDAAKYLDTQIMEASIIEARGNMAFIESINTNINLLKFEQAIGKDITKYLLRFMEKNAKDYYERKSLLKFVDWLIDFGRSAILRK